MCVDTEGRALTARCRATATPVATAVRSLMGDRSVGEESQVVPDASPSPGAVREFGSHMARLADEAEEEASETPRARCATCAFRAGTEANRHPLTLLTATGCVISGEPFYCHEGLESDDADPTTACAGWAAARRAVARAGEGAHHAR